MKKTIQCEEAFAIQLLVWQPINSLSIKLSEETHDCSINGTAGVPRNAQTTFEPKRLSKQLHFPFEVKKEEKLSLKKRRKKSSEEEASCC